MDKAKILLRPVFIQIMHMWNGFVSHVWISSLSVKLGRYINKKNLWIDFYWNFAFAYIFENIRLSKFEHSRHKMLTFVSTGSLFGQRQEVDIYYDFSCKFLCCMLILRNIGSIYWGPEVTIYQLLAIVFICWLKCLLMGMYLLVYDSMSLGTLLFFMYVQLKRWFPSYIRSVAFLLIVFYTTN